jgi:hypothetical protein
LLGVDRSVHLVPFHTSASVRLDTEMNFWPTAVQALAEVHEIPPSELPIEPVAFGVCCTAQADPFHISASVTCRNELLK